MREDIAGPPGASSRPMWETLEGMVRQKAQEFIHHGGGSRSREKSGRARRARGLLLAMSSGRWEAVRRDCALLPELSARTGGGRLRVGDAGTLGEGAPLSKSSIRRLRAGWTREFEAWAKRSLADREVVYVWADGIYVKAGLERDKAALLVVMGAMRDGTKEVLAIAPGTASPPNPGRKCCGT